MVKKMPNRKHGIIDDLPAELKDTVEQMLLTGATYSEIVEFLGKNQVSLSIASVSRYARAFHVNVQMLSMAQENFRRMMDELDRYPNLDTTEAIIRLTSQNLFNAIASKSEEDWNGVSVDKMLKETNGLIRAAAYKKRIEVQNQDNFESGLEAVKSLVFEAMSKERPELFKEVTAFLNDKKQQAKEE